MIRTRRRGGVKGWGFNKGKGERICNFGYRRKNGRDHRSGELVMKEGEIVEDHD